MPRYYAKKRLGQNFLKTASVIDKIIDAIDPKTGETIIEIGSGRGALTLPIVESGADVIAVEFDQDLIGYLTKLLEPFQNIKIINKDFLEYEPQITNYKLIGNLPYNITSPVIEWACERFEQIISAYFMTQKEVALRLASSPGSKDWSPLAIFSQLYFDIKILFDISPKHFSPPPKVTSSLIELIPKKTQLIEHRDAFERFVRVAFHQRRKTLVNNLVPDLIEDAAALKEILFECGLGENVRAEQVSTEKFLSLTKICIVRKILTYKKH